MAGNNFLVVAEETLRLTVACRCRDQNGLNIVHYQSPAGTDNFLIEDIALQHDVNCSLAYKVTLGIDAEYYGTSWRSESNLGTAPWFTDFNRAGGTTAEDSLPTQVCGIITKNTGIIGRANRGRSYIPFPGRDRQNNIGNPSAAYLNQLDIIGGTLFSILTGVSSLTANAVTLVPMVTHLPGPLNRGPITGFIVRRRWATQRKRGDYGRPNAVPW